MELPGHKWSGLSVTTLGQLCSARNCPPFQSGPKRNARKGFVGSVNLGSPGPLMVKLSIQGHWTTRTGFYRWFLTRLHLVGSDLGSCWGIHLDLSIEKCDHSVQKVGGLEGPCMGAAHRSASRQRWLSQLQLLMTKREKAV